MSSTNLRAVIVGALAGVMLSISRAPLGLDLINLPVVDGPTRALFRALPWIVLAGLLGKPARAFANGVPVGRLAAGAALGVAFDGLVLKGVWEPQSRIAFAVALLIPTLLIAALVYPKQRHEEASLDPPARLTEWAGLTLAGLGAALGLSCLAYHLQHLGLASRPEDSLRGVVLATIVALGALAFGPLLSRGKLAPLAVGIALAMTSAMVLVGVTLLEDFADPTGLDLYIKSQGLNYSLVGTLHYTALLAAVVFVAPGLAAGAALGASRDRTRLSGILLGVSVGLALWPHWIDILSAGPLTQAERVHPEATPWTWWRAAGAIWLCSAGAGVAIWYSQGGVRRWVAMTCVAACAASPLLISPSSIWILSPWHKISVEPQLSWDTPHGMLTVEQVRDGARIVTLDRRRLTPLGIEEDQDDRRIGFAWELLPLRDRESGKVRVLFVGQVTPRRATALSRLNATVDHTVPWHDLRQAVDRELFETSGIPPGRAISPDDARLRLKASQYQLVIVPPTHGPLIQPRSAVLIPWAPAPAPVSAAWEAPRGTLCVIWLDASSPIVGRALGRTLLLNSRGLDDLEVGVVLGKAYEAGPSVSWFYEAGSPTRASSPIAFLKMRPMPRQRQADAALFSRLAMANAGTPGGKLVRGLALHTAAQGLSSPFESREEQREIDMEGLELIAEARETGIDVFQIQLWEGIAEALVHKRMPDKVLRLIEPLATEAGPWPVLERAVAAAYREFTMNEEAALWLRKAADSSPFDLDLQVEAAAWSGQNGDGVGELELLERALAIQPGRSDLQRLIAIARYRAGDPEAVHTLRKMLAASPEDEELAEVLLAGPRTVQRPPGDDG